MSMMSWYLLGVGVTFVLGALVLIVGAVTCHDDLDGGGLFASVRGLLILSLLSWLGLASAVVAVVAAEIRDQK